MSLVLVPAWRWRLVPVALKLIRGSNPQLYGKVQNQIRREGATVSTPQYSACKGKDALVSIEKTNTTGSPEDQCSLASGLHSNAFICDMILPWGDYGRQDLRERTLPRLAENGVDDGVGLEEDQ